MSKGTLIFLAVVAGLAVVGFSSVPNTYPGEAFIFRAVRAILTITLIGLVISIRRLKPQIYLKEMLKNIKQLRTDICYFCNSPLDESGFCAECRLRLDQETSIGNQVEVGNIPPWIRK